MENKITVRQIMDDLTSHPLMKDIGIDYVIRCAATWIAKMGAPMMYEDRTADIAVEEWRGLLPCDFVRLNQVMVNAGMNKVPMHVHAGSYYPKEQFRGGDRLTYKVKGRVIHVSVKNCTLHVSYKAMSLDDEGFPCFENDPIVVNAFESYVMREWFYVLFSMGRISQNVYQEAKQRYAMDAAQAHEHLSTPTPDQMENIGNIINAIVPNRRPDMSGYSGLSNHDEFVKH